MVTGSLQVKKNMYYAVLNLEDKDGKRRQKWISTGYSTAGHNKRVAQKALSNLIDKYEAIPKTMRVKDEILFAEYAQHWLESAAYTYDPITYQGYKNATEKHIVPYFAKLKIRLQDIDPIAIQCFSNHLSKEGNLKTGEGLSNKSVRNYLTVLSQICEDAVQKKRIIENPVKAIKRPKKQKYKPSFYTASQMKELLMAIDKEPTGAMFKIAAVYGLRRSELLGLKWGSIDFENGQVTIQHVVSRFSTVVEKDDTKTEESHRTYPMTPEIEKIFIAEKEKEERCRVLFGDAYNENDYVFKWDNGKPYAPDYLTRKFKSILKKYHMPIIRLHDLRHSCASILLESGHNLKDVQQWLGHADIQTTGNVYGHLTNDHLKTVGSDICGQIM